MPWKLKKSKQFEMKNNQFVCVLLFLKVSNCPFKPAKFKIIFVYKSVMCQARDKV